MPVGSGAAALDLLPVLESALGGAASLLPVPADDAAAADALADALRAGAEIADDVAVVVPTSGTTGTPKGAQLTAAALTASGTATHTRLGGAGTWLLSLPAHHVAGLQVLVRSALAGTTPVAIPAGFEAADLPAAIARLAPGRRYGSMVAVQLDKALRDDAAAEALAGLDAVLIGGGPMPAAVAERAAAAGVTVVRTYGMSETAGGCVYDGVPLDGVAIRFDESGERSGGESNPVGRVVLGGPTVAAGYRNPVNPDPFAEPGWFYTDDVGELDDSGSLRILGRVDDAISTGGLKVFPQLVEAALATHPAVAEAAVFGVADDRLGQRVAAALVLTAGTSTPSTAELRDHVARTLHPTAAPREVHVVDALPRRGIGKLDRRELTARFGAGA